MFLARRPSHREIQEFIAQSRDLPLSSDSKGIANQSTRGFHLDQCSEVVGRSRLNFERAKWALAHWRHFDLGWLEVFPKHASCEPGTTLAVLIRHLGFWSLNGCRVVYSLGEYQSESKFGFAYGTLINHAEMGEEVFEVSFAPEFDEVVYEIRALSKPRATLARIGYPVTRRFQARFRRDSIIAMRRAIKERS